MLINNNGIGYIYTCLGVTLLAFGNGAPDIASSVAAIQQGGEQTKLGIGALLGAAVFNPIFISAVIATYAVDKPIEVARRPFVRDCIFLFLAATIVLVITIRGTVDIAEAIIMVLLYLVYVFSAVLTEIYNKLRKKKKSDNKRKRKSLKDKIIMPALGLFSNESMRELNAGLGCTNSYRSFEFNKQLSTISLAPVPVIITNDDDETDDDDDSDSYSLEETMSDIVEETMSDIVSNLSSEESEKNRRRHWSLKILLFILTIPIKVINYICKITIPLTDNKHWNDRIAMMSCIFSPLWILFSFGIFRKEIGIFEIWHCGLIFGIIMFLFTFYFIQKKYKYKYNTNERNESEIELTMSSSTTFTFNPTLSISINSEGIRETTNMNMNDVRQEKAVMKHFFLFLGFLSSISWIILIANELVNILTTLGIIFSIDLAILGLTVLAWGNSIGDLIADVGVSKKGYPKMGIAAAISGPTLTLLIGIGASTTLVCIEYGSANLPMSGNIFYGCLCVMFGITFYMIIIAASKWKLNKYFAYILYIYYAMFLLLNALTYQYPEIFFNFGL